MVFIDKRNATGKVDEWGHGEADTIFGSRFDDTLKGAQGNDSIRGGGGNDLILDQVYVWTGNPFLSLFLPQPDTSLEERWAETSDNTPGLLFYSGGRDSFFGEAGNDEIAGFNGNDLLDGGGDNDTIWGGDGNDTLIGGSDDGRDVLFGNDGDDDISAGDGDDDLSGGAGDDTLEGGAGDDKLNGGKGADNLRGGAGADEIRGGDLAANHFDSMVQAGLMFRAQADAMIALANNGDTASFGLLRAIDVDLERAVQIGGEAEGDTLTGIENLVGTLRGDVLRGDDKANVLEGGAGSDTLEGRGGADVLNGGTGGISGDPGLDTASYESSAAAVNIDLIRATQTGGDAQGDTLISIENLIGSRFGDQLRGDDNNNRFDGGLGNDTIDGRGGIDTLDLSAWDVAPGIIVPQVTVTLRDVGDGTATRADFVGIQNGGFRVVETDTLRGIENVLGTSARDTITGNGANNLLDGRSGNDVLSGGGGADTITGGLGSDDMTGGTGADVFDFNAFDEMSFASASTFDFIRDFQSGVDKIDLRDLGDLTAVGSFQGIAGQVQFVNGAFGGVNTPALVIDINGDNVADRAIFVQTSGPFPLNSDLLII